MAETELNYFLLSIYSKHVFGEVLEVHGLTEPSVFNLVVALPVTSRISNIHVFHLFTHLRQKGTKSMFQ